MPEYSQQGRPIKVKTPLGQDVLLLERFEGKEGISQNFEFYLQMVSISKNLKIEDLLRKPVTIYLRKPNEKDYRYFHGLARSVRLMELDVSLVTYQMEVVPWLWFLSQKSDCRLWLKKTVPEILEEVFAEHSGKFLMRLTRSYKKRDLCVQYRETDFNFVCRLMEEEGMFFYFKHTENDHTMILADSTSALENCEGQSKYKFAYQTSPDESQDYIHTVDYERNYRSGKITLAEFDFQKNRSTWIKRESVSGKNTQSEKYDYPGYDWNGPGISKGNRDWLEMEEWPHFVIRGISTGRSFNAGFKIDLSEHFNPNVNQSWLILSVHHRAEGDNYRSEMAEPFRYTNTYEAMPSRIPFRPPRLAIKPTIKGTQTAIVIDEAGGEGITVDKYGRVKVQFHWDRKDMKSCWIRVSQAWAGNNWGWMTIPRKDQEVVVSFMEGDPDRPLITGRVYDQPNKVPYRLPELKTVSTWKSSTGYVDKDGYNEIRMDDNKSHKQLFIHAEQDRDDRTKEEMREWVGKNRHMHVKENQYEHVYMNKEQKIDANKKEEIGAKYSLKVGTDYHIKVGTNYALDAGMQIHLKAGMSCIIEAGMQVSLKGPGGFVNIDPSGVQIQGTMVLINSGGAAGSGSGASPEAPREPDTADDGTKFTKMEAGPIYGNIMPE